MVALACMLRLLSAWCRKACRCHPGLSYSLLLLRVAVLFVSVHALLTRWAKGCMMRIIISTIKSSHRLIEYLQLLVLTSKMKFCHRSHCRIFLLEDIF